MVFFFFSLMDIITKNFDNFSSAKRLREFFVLFTFQQILKNDRLIRTVFSTSLPICFTKNTRQINLFCLLSPAFFKKQRRPF